MRRLTATDAKPSAIEFTRIAEARRRKTEGESTAVINAIADTRNNGRCQPTLCVWHDSIFTPRRSRYLRSYKPNMNTASARPTKPYCNMETYREKYHDKKPPLQDCVRRRGLHCLPLAEL